MALGLLFALCASVCMGTATVFQALGARRVASGGLGATVRATWQWPFLVGVVLDTLGFGAELVSLRSVPLFLVEAAVAGSLAVTAVVSAGVLHIRLRRVEWAAVGAVCCGLALMAVAAGREDDGDGDEALRLAVLLGSIVLAVVGRLVSTRCRGVRHRAALLGAMAGISFGVTAVAARLLPGPEVPGVLAEPSAYAVVVSGITGYLLLIEALQSGSVTCATAAMVTGETVWPALFGVVWLGDTTRHGLMPLAAAGFALSIGGALALARFGEAEETEQPQRTESTGDGGTRVDGAGEPGGDAD
jgi:drug/metabolite transporter (DMT)-like permease